MLQTIKGHNVLNHPSLGKAIFQFRKENTGLMLDHIGVGFMDGGCLAFATALQSFFTSVTPNIQNRIVSI